jgi:uncharacterized pyridoxamine 5'-phosphate oxidase family protein
MPGYGVPKSIKGALDFSHFENRFTANRNYYIATVSPTARPHVMPVWGVWSGGKFYFSTGATTRKARNLAENPRVTIAIEDATAPVILEGTAAVAKTYKTAALAYEKKYDFQLTPDVGNIYVVTPKKAFAFIEEAEDFGETATRWVWK